MTERAQRIVLASRPVGEPTLDNFRSEELPIPQPEPGQMLLHTRGQIARIKGGRAVGIAGGRDKCRYVIEELGFDDCVDHRAPDLAARLAAACPKGIDVYFENVGGGVFEAVFPMLNQFARIPVCGLISFYNATTLSPGSILLPHMMRAILTKRLTFRGFIVSDLPHAMTISCAMSPPGSARDGLSIAKMWSRRSRTRRAPLSASCAGRISANFWCKLRLRPCNELRDGVAGVGSNSVAGLALGQKTPLAA